jgi:hypothetical protein
VRPAYAGLRARAKVAIRGNPIVLGRKYCADCGRWRLLLDFSPQVRGSAQYSPYCRVCTARRHRRSYHAPHPAEWWALRREYARIYSQAKRREAGIPARQWRRATVVDKIEMVGLRPEPLLAVIAQLDLSDIEVARLARVTPRSIYRLRVGESRHVRLDVADKLAHALGVPLELIYGGTPARSLRRP